MSDHVVKHNLKITFLNLFLFPSADRAMLEALGGQGERSIISEKRTGNGDEDGEKSQSLKHGGSEKENDATKEEEEEKRDKDESRERHLSESEEWSKEKAEKRQDEEVEEEEEELNKEKRGNSGEEAMTKNEKGIFFVFVFCSFWKGKEIQLIK